MPRLDLHESEEAEFKRQWTDQALEDVAAFANSRGGMLLIGVEDTSDDLTGLVQREIFSRMGGKRGRGTAYRAAIGQIGQNYPDDRKIGRR